jgi:NlpC/P60 family putative phage cell wall peptidase
VREGDRLAAAALTWIGTPFRWQGRVKGVGADCKGLVAGVARACGRPEADSVEALAGDYDRVVDDRRLRAGVRRLFDPAPLNAVAPGDVLLLRLGGKVQHLGIALAPYEMVHCYGAGPHARVMQAAIPRAKLDSVWRWKVLS